MTSTSSSASGPSGLSRPNILITRRKLSELCSPVKGVSKRKRSRRTEKSEIITSPPYKSKLQLKAIQQLSKNVPKKTTPKKKKARTPKKSKLLQEKDDAETSEDEECPCLVCGEPFCNSKPREKWIQCVICGLWAHEECTLKNLRFICQNCESDEE